MKSETGVGMYTARKLIVIFSASTTHTAVQYNIIYVFCESE